MRYIIITFSIIFLVVGCDLPWDPGPQPTYLERKYYQNQFNILGIIRPGTIAGVPLSFVHLETTYDYFNIPDSTEIGDAQVTLLQFNGSLVIDTLHMTFTNFEGIFSKKEYRSLEIDSVDSILAGKTYSISCKMSGYPELTSETTIPDIPVIINNNVVIQSGKIVFDVLRDELVQVYDIYLSFGSKEFMERYVRPDIGNTHVELNFTNSYSTTGKLTIYAYDLKLSEYITYNVIIKPQTYQDRYSTVEKGYGCFGSLNILEKNLIF
jgi:hypothetical protein